MTDNLRFGTGRAQGPDLEVALLHKIGARIVGSPRGNIDLGLGRLAGNRLLFEGGVPVAVQSGGDIRYLRELDTRAQWEMKKFLVQRHHAGEKAPPSAADAEDGCVVEKPALA